MSSPPRVNTIVRQTRSLPAGWRCFSATENSVRAPPPGFMLCTNAREGDVTMAAYVTYGRALRRAPLGAMCLAAVALFGIAACGKLGLGGGSDEMSWARAALERNDRVEIVAVDPATNTFTVRIKETGDLRTVRADQAIAGPPGAPGSPAGTPAGAAAMPAATAGVEASATSD